MRPIVRLARQGTHGLLLGVVLLIAASCAHSPHSSEASERDAILEVGIRYAIDNFADPDVARAGLLCIQVDEESPSPALLESLRGDSYQVSGTRAPCETPNGLTQIVMVGNLTTTQNQAELHAGTLLGTGGTLELRKAEGRWLVVAVRRRWIASTGCGPDLPGLLRITSV
jgi:hypothetical protein